MRHLLIAVIFAAVALTLSFAAPSGGHNGNGHPLIELISPKGRPFKSEDNQIAPCGQSPLMSSAERLEWTTDDFYHVDVLVYDNDGGVLTYYFEPGPNPFDPLFRWKGKKSYVINPFDKPYELHRIKLQAPSLHFDNEPGTIQLIFNSHKGRTGFQCIDIYLNAPAARPMASLLSAAAVLLAALLVL
eukprot:CAMPEP_0177652196 /NCGR_PEP_ID=MMETSP0447-20121125/12982_1 /TAXON_ID=0 /ORGANISM="Stygamoeba regulata, Strain BSH-02190019" /LENGTH=186 /DNA_ID=CAMNT_0019155387 /DNA_START=79 /DNA_END=639 /DNA_ORIENTATION=-